MPVGAAMSALDQIQRWSVDHAAAAVVARGEGTTTVTDTRGALDHTFALASVTKVLTAMAVLVAVEEGTVALDEPAGPPGSTIRHLLAHASGLGFEGGVQSPPERRRIYSNTGFEVLGAAVSASASMPFPDYVREAVLEPLGMTDTALRGSPAHAAVATAADLARLAGELLEPRLLARATLDEATAAAFPSLRGVVPGFGRQNPNDWGLGFELRGAKAPHWTAATNSPATFGHFGRSGTFLWVDPEPGIALVALTDRPFEAWAKEAWPALSDAVLTEHG